MNKTLLTATMTTALLLTAVGSHAANITDLTALMNQRLSYMKDVAGYKAVNHLAIEDAAQEQKVLDAAAVQAQAEGIDPESIKPFITAQISAAKAIEYRYLAEWQAQPETSWQPRPLDVVRADVAALSTKIITQIHVLLAAGMSIDHLQRHDFIQSLKQPNLSRADEEQLFQALKQVKLIQK
ncbi:chorismate mutase [Aquirhabdus sp.]|uniref:chorismate mutase n=1 Tax=Aquirhabdus sp. TaxID=2824160 RepID=UPI00396C7439